MRQFWQLMLSTVAGAILGALITALSFQATIVGDIHSNNASINSLHESLITERQERQFSDSQLEAHLQQYSDLMKQAIDQNSQLIALIRAQNQINRN